VYDYSNHHFNISKMRPVYFDLTVADINKAKSFFSELFGWRFEKFDMPFDYYRIFTGPASEPGIDGGAGLIKDAPLSGGHPLTVITIEVKNIEECLEKISALGGKIVEPKNLIPTIGWYATGAEPGGLLFGMIQPDPNAH
jgi:predicted enzyme related to lactoylglutathione lyase